MAPLVYFRYVLVGVLISGFTGFAFASSIKEVEQLDEADRQEFNASVARASACGKARDFQCASNALVQAKKYANGSRDNSILKAAAENIEFMSQMSTQDDAKQKYGKERIAWDTRTAESQRAALADAERSNSLQRQRQAEKEREDRQSANDDEAAPIDDWRKRDDAFWRNVREQDSARITEGYRKRDEQQAELARQRAESNERAAEQRRDAQRDRNARVAQADTDRQQSQQRQQAEQVRARDQELIRQKQAKEAADRLVAEQDRAREQESNRQRQAKEKADQLAAQEAKKAAEQQTKKEYFDVMIRGIRLVAIKCPDGAGHYYATGTEPKIKEEVACIDVHYKASCSGSGVFSSGVAKNFVGLSGCFGDTYQIEPKPGCKVDQVRVEVTDVQQCN